MRKISIVILWSLLLFPAFAWASDDPEQSPDSEYWFYRESIDPITDEDASAALVTSEDGDAMVSFNCREGDIMAAIVIQGHVFARDGRTLTYRFRGDEDVSDGDPMDVSWPRSSDSTILLVPGSEVPDFARNVLGYDGLVLRGYDYRGTSSTHEIDLTGDAGFVERLSCFDESMLSDGDEAEEETSSDDEESADEGGTDPDPSGGSKKVKTEDQ